MAEAGRDLTSALFGMDASSLTPAFQQKLGEVSQRLGTNPDDLLAVMRFETGGTLNPGARNRAGSGATGLIQFMPDTAKNLGTTTDALAQMTPESQLEYVEKYLTPHKGKLGTLKDTYMAVLSPQAIGKPEWYPLFTKGTKAYEQNAGLDVEKKGHVTVGDAVGSVLRFAGRALSPSRADAATPGGRDLTTTMEPARGGSGRDLTDMLFGAPAVGTPTEAPASQPTPGTAPQAAPPPTTQPGASQGPSGARLSLGDSTEAASEAEAAATVARLRASQTGAAGLQPPPADLSALAVGGGPSQQAPTVTDPAALLAVGGRPQAASTAKDQQTRVREELAAWEKQAGRPWREGDPRMPSEKRLGVPDEAPVEETLSRPSVWGPLIAGVAGGVGGAALGRGAAALLGRGATALPIVGEALGSLGARKADVALGIEEPGTVGDVLSAAIPLVGRAVGAIAPAIVRRLPGSAGAQHEMMAERLQALPANMAPATPSQTLYRAVVQHGNPAIPVQDLRQTAQELLTLNTQRGAATRNPRVVRLAQEIEDLAQQYNNNVPMDVLYDRMQGAGEILRQARRTGGRGERDLSRIYAGFHRSLENAAQSGIPGAETLQQAIQASRQEHAVDRLGRIVGQGRGIEEQTGSGYMFVKGKKMLSEFDRLVADDPVFAGSFAPGELAEMRGLFQEATRLPALPPGGGAHHGSGRAATRAAVGSVFGGPVGAAIAVSGPEVIARAMMTRPGRAMLRAALEGQGGLTPQALAVLNTALREQLPAEP